MKSARLRKKRILPGTVKLREAKEAYYAEKKSIEEFDIDNILSEIFEKFPEPAKTKLRNLFSLLIAKSYRSLTKELKNFFGTFEPMQFFEILFGLCNIAENNKMRPIALKEYWVSLNLNNRELYFLLRHFNIMLSKIEKQSVRYIMCKSFIETELKKLKEEINAIDKTELSLSKIEKTISTDREIQANSTKLKAVLKKYGFFDLKMVFGLPKESTEKVIEFLISNELPYQISMINFLGFIKHLEKEYFTKVEVYRFLAEILSTTERAVKGNCNVLNESSKENKKRYTSYLYNKTVQKDYQKLK